MELGNEGKAEADEGRGQGMLSDEVDAMKTVLVRRLTVRDEAAETIRQLEKRFELRKHARLKSPAIMASKARLRRRRAERIYSTPRKVKNRVPIGFDLGTR